MKGYQFLIAAVVLGALYAFTFRVSGKMADFEVYWRGASRAAAAEPLYRADDEHYRFKYLPTFAVLTIPLSVMPLATAKVVWFTGSVALLVLLVWISLRLLPERRQPTALLVLLVIVVLGKFFGHELILGQVNILFGVLAAAAFLAMRAGHERLAGALIALTIAIKPYGVLFLPWLVARGKIASLGAAVATAAAIAVLPMAIYGFSETIALHRAWWSTVSETTPSNLLNPDNVSFASMWVKWLGPGTTATSLAVVTGLAAGGAAVLVFIRRGGIAFPDALEGSLLLMLVPLLSPQGWDYVLLLAAPAVLVLANYGDQLPNGMRAAAIVAALTMGLSLFDVMGRNAYTAFMETAAISVCACVLIAAVCLLRLRRVA
jgi:glycosyl transferase family 87